MAESTLNSIVACLVAAEKQLTEQASSRPVRILLKAVETLPDEVTWSELAGALVDFAARRSALTAEQLVELGARLGVIPGVDPSDVWAAASEADAGRLTPHAEVFARRRARK